MKTNNVLSNWTGFHGDTSHIAWFDRPLCLTTANCCMDCPFPVWLYLWLLFALHILTALFISEGSAGCLWSWAAELLGVTIAEIQEGCGSSAIRENGPFARIMLMLVLEFNKMLLLISPGKKKKKLCKEDSCILPLNGLTMLAIAMLWTHKFLVNGHFTYLFLQSNFPCICIYRIRCCISFLALLAWVWNAMDVLMC